jgi:hypothetical protein
MSSSAAGYPPLASPSSSSLAHHHHHGSSSSSSSSSSAAAAGAGGGGRSHSAASAGAGAPSWTPVTVTGSGVKRTASGEEVGVLSELELRPLGAGCEVGRSCHILRFKGKTIMLDCGVLPSFQGIEALPLIQEVNPADIDIIFIT